MTPEQAKNAAALLFKLYAEQNNLIITPKEKATSK